MPFDVIVVGGSYAGMAAALQLVRAWRRVVVIDAGRVGTALPPIRTASWGRMEAIPRRSRAKPAISS